MKDTVEVRLQVPKQIHELIQRQAVENRRTTHNEYIVSLEMLKKLQEGYKCYGETQAKDL